jgi:hypothetical protein
MYRPLFALLGFDLVFTDAALDGLAVEETSDSFWMGGMSATLVGDTLTLTVAPDCPAAGVTACSGWPASQTADFSFSSATPVPEPSSLAALSAGLLGLGLIRHRRHSHC